PVLSFLDWGLLCPHFEGENNGRETFRLRTHRRPLHVARAPRRLRRQAVRRARPLHRQGGGVQRLPHAELPDERRQRAREGLAPPPPTRLEGGAGEHLSRRP